ncbi:MAG: hypothetical protein ACOC1D_05700 [Prolixibacteraceae bacterium]
MTRNQLVITLLVVLLLGDFIFSFAQYYTTPLSGDFAGAVLPNEHVQRILDDPFGINMMRTGEKHLNPNRFFSHVFFSEYFQHVPHLLQKIVNPVSSVYLASAIIKIIIQILFIFILAGFISGSFTFNKTFVLIALLVTPLFQVYGFWSRMGINDKSVVYSFFYALPLVFLMLFFLPVFKQLQSNKKIKTYYYLLLSPLVVILPLSGPLIPAVILLITFIIFSWHFFYFPGGKLSKFFKTIPASVFILLIPACIISLYSLFLGFYDSNYAMETIPLTQRYKMLPEGIYSQLFHSLGFPLMLLFIGINTWYINKTNSPEGKKLIHILIWIGVFASLYVVLLPFGGYRPYRPRIIRYDTFMPVTTALIYYFGASTYFLLHHLKRNNKRNYVAAIIVCLLVFTFADMKGIGRNRCERQALEKMAQSEEKIIAIPKDCLVLDWHNVHDYRQSEVKAELIHYWGITDKKILFYNEP